MLKKLKSILFVICIVMVFTAQTRRPDEKGQHAPAARPVPAARTAPVVHSQSRPQIQNRPQVQTRKAAAPPRVVQRSLPRVKINIPRPLDERREMPRVYAVRASAPVKNNRLFHRQHHKNWQPRYNFYGNQYHFYPYINVTSPVELSVDYVSIGLDGQNYWYDQGAFYQQDARGLYFAVAPPVGIIVNSIPAQARQINVDGRILYRYKGVFYVQVAQGYQVVEPVQSPSDDS